MKYLLNPKKNLCCKKDRWENISSGIRPQKFKMRQEFDLAQAHFDSMDFCPKYVDTSQIDQLFFLPPPVLLLCLLSSGILLKAQGLSSFTYIAGLLKMASSAIMTSPGFLRLLSSRTAYGTIPIWNCRSNENFYNSSPLSILTMSAQPKPVSMSPFLGVRLCSSSSIREPSKVSSP